MKIRIIILYAYAIWNIFCFILMGIDKRKAIKNKKRISEFSILSKSFLMGALGTLLGMLAFRHKTRKIKFKILVPLSLVLNIVIVYLIYKYLPLIPN